MKLSIQKYAAIDIGSNAVRLLISNIIKDGDSPARFKKSSLVRVPIRLGADVFLNNSISQYNIQRMCDTMMAFNLLMKSHHVVKYKACATSAMREAQNGQEIVQLIAQKTNIEIDIIDGQEEAIIIASTDLNQYIDYNKTYLYVDVGGGSTEFTFFHLGKQVASQSFKIGTVRLLNNMVKTSVWNELKQWISTYSKTYDKINIIGSGGNINKVFKLSGTKIGKPLNYIYLTGLYKELNTLTYEQRITKFDLNQDRADVIIPAMRIYLSAIKWSGAQDIYVPKIGLADGIIKSIYHKTVSSNTL